MKPYDLDAFALVVSPDMVMIDTNVLVSAFFDTGDGLHETARDYLDLLGDYGIALVPVPVLVETWGWLVGSRGSRNAGLQLLTWALDPVRVRLIPGHETQVGAVEAISKQFAVDLVDAWILLLTSDMQIRCELSRPIQVATFDTRDFLKCAGSFPFRMIDLRSNEEIDLD